MFKLLWPYLRQHYRAYSTALAAAVCAQLIAIPLPMLTRWFLNHLHSRHSQRAGGAGWNSAAVESRVLLMMVVVFGGLIFVRGLFRWAQEYLGEWVAQQVLADVRMRMYHKVQHQSGGYFDRRPAGRLIVRFIGDANSLRTLLARTALNVPADALTVAGIAVALAWIQPQLAAAATLPILVVLPALVFINPRARRWTRNLRRTQSRLCGELDRRIGALAAVKVANAQDGDHSDVSRMIGEIANQQVQRSRLDAWLEALAIAGTTGTLGAMVLWGAHLLQEGRVTHSDILAAVWLTVLVRGPTGRLLRANVAYQRARVAVERIDALLRRSDEPGWAPDLAAYQGPGDSITLRRLGYRDAQGRWVIRGLNAAWRRPGLIAITGDAGWAGSILLELLVRVRRSHEGRIRFDGLDVRRIRVGDLRSQIGWLDGQRRALDALVLRFRSDPEDTTAKLRRVWSLTADLAAGMDFERLGSLLQSGDPPDRLRGRFHTAQLLRLDLCAALVDDPPVWLLDEPTRNLEHGDVQQLLDFLRRAAASRLIVVATRHQRLLEAATEVVTLPGRPPAGRLKGDRNSTRNGPIVTASQRINASGAAS